MTNHPADHVDGILAQWRRERPDLDVAPLGLLGRLFRFTQFADDALAEGVRPFGLQRGWFDLLAALRRAGAPYELSPTQLMEATLLSSGGITKRLERLVEAGLVERRPDPGDGRGRLARLTPRGKKTIDEALVRHLANEETLLRSLGANDRRLLDSLLRTLLTDAESG